jgi:DNA-binding NarL/FixJ family response regulator
MPAAIAELRSQPARSDERRPSATTTVLVYAKDPISRAGVASQLAGVPGVGVVAPGQDCRPDVAVVVADAVDHEVLRVVRTIRRAGGTQVVVVARALDPASVLAAMDAGAAAFLPVRRADRDRLVDLVVAAHRGEAVVPSPSPDAGADPAADARREHPSWPPATAAAELTGRELNVLRLLAEGYDTAEVAGRLAYSEPTIKNVIQRLFERLQVRNRPHAVAVAMRAGII